MSFSSKTYTELKVTPFFPVTYEENKLVIGMSATTHYGRDEEFNYAYSSDLRPIQLLYSYGMHFPNNPYAITYAR